MANKGDRQDSPLTPLEGEHDVAAIFYGGLDIQFVVRIEFKLGDKGKLELALVEGAYVSACDPHLG